MPINSGTLPESSIPRLGAPGGEVARNRDRPAAIQRPFVGRAPVW
jgi:hypothetical protein